MDFAASHARILQLELLIETRHLVVSAYQLSPHQVPLPVGRKENFLVAYEIENKQLELLCSIKLIHIGGPKTNSRDKFVVFLLHPNSFRFFFRDDLLRELFTVFRRLEPKRIGDPVP